MFKFKEKYDWVLGLFLVLSFNTVLDFEFLRAISILQQKTNMLSHERQKMRL